MTTHSIGSMDSQVITPAKIIALLTQAVTTGRIDICQVMIDSGQLSDKNNMQYCNIRSLWYLKTI